MKSKRFNELDIVRGFAACWVVGVHFWLFNVIPAFLGYKDFFEYIKAVGQAYSLEKFFPLAFNTPGNIIFDCLNTFFLLGYQGVHIFFLDHSYPKLNQHHNAIAYFLIGISWRSLPHPNSKNTQK
jgi:peptidoglycan/LPS O-acetylase OafA/YrhL